MGTLYLEQLAEERGVDVDAMSFNPMRLTGGIEASGDQILLARGEVYQLGMQGAERDRAARCTPNRECTR